MTLPSIRDYFIGQAIAGILANQTIYPTPKYARVWDTAQVAIRVADAALELTNRGGGQEVMKPYKTITDGDVTYTPWTDGESAVGFRCEHKDGRIEFVYLNPSTGEGHPNVFLYHGTKGDQKEDSLEDYVIVFEEKP